MTNCIVCLLDGLMATLIRHSQMFFSLFFTLMLIEMCESSTSDSSTLDSSKLIGSPISNLTQGSDRNLSRQRRFLNVPARSLVFPDDSQVIITTEITIPLMTTSGLSQVELAIPLTFDLPSMKKRRSFNLENNHRDIFHSIEEFLAG